MSDVNKLWNSGKDKLSEEQLMAYLEGRAGTEQQREIERLLSEEGMESDAVEGLKELQPESTAHSVQKLNRQLHRLTYKRKRRTRPFSENKWTWIAMLIVLLLCILGYAVLHQAGKQ